MPDDNPLIENELAALTRRMEEMEARLSSQINTQGIQLAMTLGEHLNASEERMRQHVNASEERVNQRLNAMEERTHRNIKQAVNASEERTHQRMEAMEERANQRIAHASREILAALAEITGKKPQ